MASFPKICEIFFSDYHFQTIKIIELFSSPEEQPAETDRSPEEKLAELKSLQKYGKGDARKTNIRG